MKYKVDITSDPHWDFWIPYQDPEYVQVKKFNLLFDIILPEVPSKILCIAGDLGHFNDQNLMAFRILKERGYESIVYCFGNHDRYLVSKAQARKYDLDSGNRLKEMVKLTSQIEGVYHINGTLVDIGGLKIGGAEMWYDFQYGIINHESTVQSLYELWRARSNDSRMIFINTINGMVDCLALFKEQYALMEKVYKDCDIVMSHVGPDWSQIHPRYKEASTSFFYFDGGRLLASMSPKQVWLHGHTHDCFSFTHKSGVQIHCNPLGYPLAGDWQFEPFSQRIKTIEIEK